MILDVFLENSEKVRIFDFEKIVVKNFAVEASGRKTIEEIGNSEIENFFPATKLRYTFVGSNKLNVGGDAISYIVLNTN
ncbi:hypothetical protein ABTQ33_07690 [Paucilactobacillus suebicus]|nr:hypothetical protein [Paucilactobacillus suebicus]